MLFLSTKQPTPILSAIEETIEAISISFSHEAFLQYELISDDTPNMAFSFTSDARRG